MRADLVVEGDDVVAVVRSKQDAVAGVGLLHQRLDRAQHVRLGSEHLERILAGYHFDLTSV